MWVKVYGKYIRLYMGYTSGTPSGRLSFSCKKHLFRSILPSALVLSWGQEGWVAVRESKYFKYHNRDT